MTIHWFTDRDRQEMQEAQEESAFLGELLRKYARTVTPEPMTPAQLRMFDRMSLLNLSWRDRK
jgi:hypothetical protein